MKKLKFLLASIFISLSIIGISAPAFALDAGDSVCEGIGQVDPANCNDESGVNNLVASVINILSWVLGIVGVIMIMVGGIKYTASGGDTNKVSSAKGTILFAVVGVVIAAFTQIILRFVLKKTLAP